MHIMRRRAAWAFLVVLFAAAVALGGGWWWARGQLRASLPALDGALRGAAVRIPAPAPAADALARGRLAPGRPLHVPDAAGQRRLVRLHDRDHARDAAGADGGIPGAAGQRMGQPGGGRSVRRPAGSRAG